MENELDDQKSTVYLRGTQLPLVANDATTGHKLQGSTVSHICVPSWNYSLNWPHVVTSRVRTLQGLHINTKLDPSKDYSVPEELIRLLRFFKQTKSPIEFDYDELDLEPNH